MKKILLSIFLIAFFTCASAEPAEAITDIYWTWFLEPVSYNVYPGDVVFFTGYILNQANSTQNLTPDYWYGASMSNVQSGGIYLFSNMKFGIEGDLGHQFAGMNLSPGETWSFTFATGYINPNASLGSYLPPLALMFKSRAYTISPDMSYILRTANVIVEQQPPVVPEPSTIFLFGVGLAALIRFTYKLPVVNSKI